MSADGIPTFELENELLRRRPIVIGLDEVGRGAIAGPVTVGAALFTPVHMGSDIPHGLRDSKLIAERHRPHLAERAADWAADVSLGWSTAAEVDALGIMRALGLAANRAVMSLATRGHPVPEAAIILDGDRDYLTSCASLPLRVRAVAKADRDCASVSAASVWAKVARDAVMVDLHDEHPDYAWARNKGYASPTHRAAIRMLGLTSHHRSSWAIGATASADPSPSAS